jgi:putative Holliday junction resolvase
MTSSSNTYLALDIGERRIGVAVAAEPARLPRALPTIDRSKTPDIMASLKALVTDQSATQVIAGLPRGMDGQETAQTASVRTFVGELSAELGVPVALQDEAGTSLKAEDELRARGSAYDKGDIDALAATYILEDWLAGQGRSA